MADELNLSEEQEAQSGIITLDRARLVRLRRQLCEVKRMSSQATLKADDGIKEIDNMLGRATD